MDLFLDNSDLLFLTFVNIVIRITTTGKRMPSSVDNFIFHLLVFNMILVDGFIFLDNVFIEVQHANK